MGEWTRSRDLFLNFRMIGSRLYLSGTDKARDFKFGVQIDRQAYKPENAKVGQKGRGLRHVTYFYNFCTPYYIYRTAELANFKFGA